MLWSNIFSWYISFCLPFCRWNRKHRPFKNVYYALQGGSNFRVCGWNFHASIQMKQLIVLKTEVVLTLKSVDEILEQKLLGNTLLGAVYYATIRAFALLSLRIKFLKCDNSNESYWAELSCDITLASVNEVLNEIYEVIVSFDTVCQMKFGNIKFKLPSWWSDITLEKLAGRAPFKMWS